MSNINQSQNLYPPKRNSIIDKMLTREKVWTVIGIFSLFGAVNSGSIFFPFLIFFIILYSITERDKSKVRIVTFLKQQPQTTVAQLSRVLDKPEKHVITVLKIMILDDGAPIRFDLSSLQVTKVGKFPGENNTQPSPANQTQVVTKQPVSQPEIQVVYEEVMTASADQEFEEQTHLPKINCVQCDELLPVNAKFCSGCGLRQI